MENSALKAAEKQYEEEVLGEGQDEQEELTDYEMAIRLSDADIFRDIGDFLIPDSKLDQTEIMSQFRAVLLVGEKGTSVQGVSVEAVEADLLQAAGRIVYNQFIRTLRESYA